MVANIGMGGETTRPFLGESFLVFDFLHRGDPCVLEKFWNFNRPKNLNSLFAGVLGVLKKILSKIEDKIIFSPKIGRVVSPPIPMC